MVDQPPDPMVQLEAAIMVRLGATTSSISDDPALATLLPGGVHSRSAGGDVYPFLTLGLVRMQPFYTYTHPWRYQFRYNLSVTDEGEAIDAASAALQRVFELLQDQGDQMSMEDFTVGFIRRGGRTNSAPNAMGVVYQRITDEFAIEVYPK